MSEHAGWAAIGQSLFAGTPMPADDDPTPPEPNEPAPPNDFQQWAIDADTEAHARLAQRTADKYGVPAQVLKGDTLESLEEHAQALGEMFRPAAPVIPGQGSTPAPPEGMSPDTRAMLDLISAPHLRSL